MDNQRNKGVLLAPLRAKDYTIIGGVSKIELVRVVENWEQYLPETEKQYSTKVDFLDCVTMSGPDHCIATQLNYLLKTNQLSDEAVNFFQDEGYIKNGLFSLSSRFNAKMNGTDKLKGQYLYAAADHVKNEGILPEMDWPTTDDMSWDEFYKEIPQPLKDKAKKSKLYIDIKYQFVNDDQIPTQIKIAPIQIATQICPGWDSGNVVQKCSGLPLAHATMLYGYDANGNFKDFDHYWPYKQILEKNYELPHNLQYVVKTKNLLQKGMRGKNVVALQDALRKLGYNIPSPGIFGPLTQVDVIDFQKKHGLAPDGIVGPETTKKINDMLGIKKTLLDAIIAVESNGDDFAEGDTNLTNHAYGCLQIRQGVCDDVNKKYGTLFLAENCLGNRKYSIEIWEKYWTVYPLIKNDEDRAKTWNGGPGWKQIYFLQNKTDDQIRYCKNLDNYWNKVRSLLY